MAVLKIIENERFGSLVILHEYNLPFPEPRNGCIGIRRVQYRCDCGIVSCTYKKYVTSGIITKCRHCLNNILEWGKKYGSLTVLGRDLINTRRYRCRCDCGDIKTYPLKSLQRDFPKCVACVKGKINPLYPTEEMFKNNPHLVNYMPKLIGQQIGNFKVLKFAFFHIPDNGKKCEYFYSVKCICGKVYNKNYKSLKIQNSCGCLRNFDVHTGSNSHFSKLKEEEIQSIRDIMKTGFYSINQVAEMYGIRKNYLHTILSKKVWKNVD